ncbi:MAG: DUF302 domain-containing protein [Kitasatospora sp.]|jgi:uncharacterized protein (DUF302 family)|nr:DUF302 domain-containing protein [Kitasatospora sp.]
MRAGINDMETVMSGPSVAAPAGTGSIAGIVNTPSPHGVSETVSVLTEEIAAAGAKVFAVVDHSGEAARVELSLRETKLVIFGNPKGGTGVMAVAPLAAIDLPLKLLVWEDDEGAVWMSHLDPQWLAERYGLAADMTAPLAAPGALAGRAAAHADEK